MYRPYHTSWVCVHQCARGAGSALALTAKRKGAGAYDRRATADKAEAIRGPGGQSALAEAATRPGGWRLCAAGLPVSAAPHVAASPVAARRADLLRPCQAQLPSASPPSSRPTLFPSPYGIAMDAASRRCHWLHRAGL